MMHLAIAVNDSKKSFMSSLIALFTWSKAYHCELVFSDGIALTSNPQHGVHFDHRGYDPYGWVVLPLPWITEEDEEEIKEWSQWVVNNNRGYDYFGAFFRQFNCKLENPYKWFCSELCREALKNYTPSLSKDERWWTPNDLWLAIVEFLEEYDSRYSDYRFYRLCIDEK